MRRCPPIDVDVAGQHSPGVTDNRRGARAARTEATVDPARPLSAVSLASGPSRFLALYEIGRQFLEQREPAQVLRTIHEALVEHLAPDQACLLAGSGPRYRTLFTRGLELGDDV